MTSRDIAASPGLDRTLFEASDQGLCILEKAATAPEAPLDFRYVAANPTFMALSGFVDVVGKTMRELIPDIEPATLDRYHRVAATGIPIQFETPRAAGDRWLAVTAYPAQEPGQVAVIVTDITTRKQTEAALREREAQSRTLFEVMDEGYARYAVVADADGMPVDMHVLKVNAAYERLMRRPQPEGKRLREIAPELDQEWVEAMAAVARSGEAQRFERFNAALDRWFDVCVTPASVGRDEVVLIFNDITERKAAEEILQQSEERQAFLLHLSDALRPLTDPEEVRATAMRLMGSHLLVNRAAYVDAADKADTMRVVSTFTHDVEPWAGVISLADFGAALGEDFALGKTVAIRDVATDLRFADSRDTYAALEIGAAVGVPLVKGGRIVAAMGVHNKTSRDWTPAEITLIETVGERTWEAVERARVEEALTASEDKYRTLFESIDEGVSTFEIMLDENGQAFDLIFLENNEAIARHTGLPRDVIGKRLSEIMPNVETVWLEAYTRVVETGISERIENVAAGFENRWFDVYFSRVGGDGSRIIVAVYQDITERKRREADLVFLAEVSQDLAYLTNIDETMNALGEAIGAHFGLSACAFAELREEATIGVIEHGWRRADVPSLLGTYLMAEFVTPDVLQRCRAGEAVVIRDVFDDPLTDGEQYAALHIGSFVSMPLVRGGEWRFLLVVYRSEPSDWREDDIALLRELTNRIWMRLERARAEEGLQKSEARLQRMIDTPGVGVLIFDRSGTLLETNDAFLAMTGYSREAVVARQLTWQTLTPPEYVAISEEQLRRLDAEGQIGPYEKEYLRADGSRSWMMFAGAALGDGTIVEYCLDISDRQRAEAALSASEERFRTFAENATDTLWIVDAETGQLEYLSPAFEETWGEPRDAAMRDIGRWAELVHHEDRAGASRVLQDVITGQRKTLIHEYRIVRPADGAIRWIHDTGFAIHDATGAVHRVAGIAHDMTDQKQAAEALQQSEERYRTLFESMDQGFCTIEVLFDDDDRAIDYVFLEMNPAFARHTGLVDALGQRVRALLPTHEDYWFRIYGEVARTGEPRRFEAEAAALGIYFNVYAFQVGRPEQHQVAILFEDVTARRDMEDALRASEERFRLIVEEATDYAIFSTDAARRIETWSPGAEAVFGWQAAEAIGQLMDIAYTPEDQANGVATREFVIAREQGQAPNVRWHQRQDGSRVFIEGMTYARRGADSAFNGVFKIGQDVTARLLAEEALRQSEASLQRRVEAATRELRSLSRRLLLVQEEERRHLARELHDEIGQALTGLNFQLAAATGKNRKTLADAQSQVQALTEQVRQLSLDLRPGVLDRYGLLAALQWHAERYQQRTGITVDLSHEGLEQRLAPEVEIGAYRVVQEALTNVARHAETDTASVQLVVDDRLLTVVVRDGGRGFDQIEGASSVGLGGMRERVDLLGGAIDIESTPGVGTAVTAEIPLGEPNPGRTDRPEDSP